MADDPSLGGPSERPAGWSQDVDTVFDLLAHSYRRRVLAALADADDALTLDSLAEEVVARAPDLGPADEEPVRVSLHHVHLPKLAAADVVAYEDGVVRPADVGTVERVLAETGLYEA